MKKWIGLAVIAIGCMWWGWSLTHVQLPEGTAIFSNQCRDDLDLLFVTAIRSAKESVHLEIFSLTRGRIIRELNRAAERGCAVFVAYNDKHTSRPPLYPDICPGYPDKLVCDDETAQRVTERWAEYFA